VARKQTPRLNPERRSKTHLTLKESTQGEELGIDNAEKQMIFFLKLVNSNSAAWLLFRDPRCFYSMGKLQEEESRK